MFTSLLLVFAIFCVYFGLPFDPCFFLGGTIYIYIYICARRLHDLFVHFGRNAIRMRECQRMHSCPIPRPRPRFAQKSCGKSWKYQDQDPRFGKSWKYQDQDPRFGKSWKYQDQDQDLHRSLVKNLGNTKTKIQDLENLGNTKTKTKICTEVLWKILEIPRSKIQFQDFSQDFCANPGLGLGISKIFQILDLGLGISKIFHKTSVQILVLVLVFPIFSKSWSWSWYFQDFPNLGSWSWYFQDFPQDFCANLGSWSWYWAGMHSLAFSGSDKIALSTV